MMDRIEVLPTRHFGKPCIGGTRITVENVLELVKEGISFAEIIRDYYPELQLLDVHACLQYAIALVSPEHIEFSPVGL